MQRSTHTAAAALLTQHHSALQGLECTAESCARQSMSPHHRKSAKTVDVLEERGVWCAPERVAKGGGGQALVALGVPGGGALLTRPKVHRLRRRLQTWRALHHCNPGRAASRNCRGAGGCCICLATCWPCTDARPTSSIQCPGKVCSASLCLLTHVPSLMVFRRLYNSSTPPTMSGQLTRSACAAAAAACANDARKAAVCGLTRRPVSTAAGWSCTLRVPLWSEPTPKEQVLHVWASHHPMWPMVVLLSQITGSPVSNNGFPLFETGAGVNNRFTIRNIASLLPAREGTRITWVLDRELRLLPCPGERRRLLGLRLSCWRQCALHRRCFLPPRLS